MYKFYFIKKVEPLNHEPRWNINKRYKLQIVFFFFLN